jgi:hypothetical protein
VHMPWSQPWSTQRQDWDICRHNELRVEWLN